MTNRADDKVGLSWRVFCHFFVCYFHNLAKARSLERQRLVNIEPGRRDFATDARIRLARSSLRSRSQRAG